MFQIGNYYDVNGWPKKCTHVINGIPHFGLGNWYRDRIDDTPMSDEAIYNHARRVVAVNSVSGVMHCMDAVDNYVLPFYQWALWERYGETEEYTYFPSLERFDYYQQKHGVGANCDCGVMCTYINIIDYSELCEDCARKKIDELYAELCDGPRQMLPDSHQVEA